LKIKEKEFDLLINELKEIANKLGINVRFEKGDFKGGYCVVKENKIIIINKFASNQKKAAILATALKELGIEELYLTPRIREIINELTENE
jgi:N-dimethylarginine dimethylaminohydrolase